MIVSGGFTDEDWHSLPVWAYDLTSGNEIMERWHKNELLSLFIESTGEDGMSKEELKGNNGDEEMELYEHPWVSMVFSGGEDGLVPHGRVGHLSSTYNDCLYIFGGLKYDFGFSVEYPDDGYNSLVVWKGCGLNHYLKKREGLVWERIVPVVHGEFPMEPGQSGGGDSNSSNSSDADDDASFSATSQEEDDDNDNEEGERLRRKLLPNSTEGFIITNDNKKRNPEEQQGQKTILKKPSVNISILPRGESQGGHYAPQDDDKEYFIFHGGVIQGDLETNGDIALGDVWKYDYEENTLTLLAPYPPLQWQHDERNELYPVARTAHAATVVGDELIIHGGMHPSEDILDEMSSAFSSPSDSYATYKTHSKWKPLSDVWVFNLKTLKWKERIQFPQMARSYHTIVGNDDGQIAAFGGFQQDTSQYSTETVVFVFKDLLISRPNEMYWLKLMPEVEPISHSLIRQNYRSADLSGITNRLEHSAILDKNGSMFVWGGRFQTVSQISGLWRLDVFTEDANLILEVAPPDGIEAYEKELEALHLFLVTMMFTSLTISSLLNSMRGRRGEEQETMERSSSHRRGGLSQDVIDSLPTKRYEAPRQSVTDDGDVVEDVSLSRENSVEESDLPLETNADCCAICLVEYEEGVSEIKTLPCGHAFDKECIDSWLEGHTTCPACRQGIENTPLSTRSEASIIRSGSILFSSWLSPNTGIWSPISNETGSEPIPDAATSSDTSNDDEEDNVGVQVADSRRRGLFRFFTRRVHEPIPAQTPNDLELV